MAKKKILFFGGTKDNPPVDEETKKYIHLFRQILTENNAKFINTDGRIFGQYLNTAVALYARDHKISETDLQTYYSFIPTPYLQLLDEQPLQIAKERIASVLSAEKIDIAICMGGLGSPYKDILQICQAQKIPILCAAQNGGVASAHYIMAQRKMGEPGFFAKQVKKYAGNFRDTHTKLATDLSVLPMLVRLCLEEDG